MPEKITFSLISNVSTPGKAAGILTDECGKVRFARCLHQYVDMVIHQADSQHRDIVFPGDRTKQRKEHEEIALVIKNQINEVQTMIKKIKKK